MNDADDDWYRHLFVGRSNEADKMLFCDERDVDEIRVETIVISTRLL
jgi:pyruvate formate-lyase activating enzyme-like uncharacterized protein